MRIAPEGVIDAGSAFSVARRSVPVKDRDAVTFRAVRLIKVAVGVTEASKRWAVARRMEPLGVVDAAKKCVVFFTTVPAGDTNAVNVLVLCTPRLLSSVSSDTA